MSIYSVGGYQRPQYHGLGFTGPQGSDRFQPGHWPEDLTHAQQSYYGDGMNPGNTPGTGLGGVYGLGNTCAPYEAVLSREEDRQYTRPNGPSRWVAVSADDCRKASAAAKRLAAALRFVKRIQYVNDGFQKSAEGEIERAESLIRSMVAENYTSMLINLNEVKGLLRDRDYCLQNLSDPICAQIKEHQDRTADKEIEKLEEKEKEHREEAKLEDPFDPSTVISPTHPQPEPEPKEEDSWFKDLFKDIVGTGVEIGGKIIGNELRPDVPGAPSASVWPGLPMIGPPPTPPPSFYDQNKGLVWAGVGAASLAMLTLIVVATRR